MATPNSRSSDFSLSALCVYPAASRESASMAVPKTQIRWGGAGRLLAGKLYPRGIDALRPGVVEILLIELGWQ